MKLDASDIASLQPLIDAAVESALKQLGAHGPISTNHRLGHTEPEAAAMLGIAAHVLGDARRRGEISARRVGKRYVYSRDELQRFLSAGGDAR